MTRSLTLACAASAFLASCGAVPMSEIEAPDALEVHLDGNASVVVPGRRLKFFVDVFNRSPNEIVFDELRVELRVTKTDTPPEDIALRQTWRYRDGTAGRIDPPRIRPDRRLTLPVVPEEGSAVPLLRGQKISPSNLPNGSGEFPLALLAPGDYDVVAVVNDQFTSRPYRMKVARPDLHAARRSPARSTMSPQHRRVDSRLRSGQSHNASR